MGALYCLFAAIGFGILAVFAKLAYAEGVDTESLLLLRFALAAAVLLPLAARQGTLRSLSPRAVVIGLLMGAIGYAAQAGLYFSALTRVDASTVALVFSCYPILVMVTAVLIGRERATPTRVIAAVVALAGVCLVVGATSGGSFDAVGAAMALGSACVYTCYILTGDRLAADIPPLALTSLVCVGGASTFALHRLVTGAGAPAVPAMAWLWVALLVIVSTVGAILFFFAGLNRVGPTVASLIGLVEAVVTVAAAALIFGESLTLMQIVGGAVVLAAVAAVQWRGAAVPISAPVEESRSPGVEEFPGPSDLARVL